MIIRVKNKKENGKKKNIMHTKSIKGNIIK